MSKLKRKIINFICILNVENNYGIIKKSISKKVHAHDRMHAILYDFQYIKIGISIIRDKWNDCSLLKTACFLLYLGVVNLEVI